MTTSKIEATTRKLQRKQKADWRTAGTEWGRMLRGVRKSQKVRQLAKQNDECMDCAEKGIHVRAEKCYFTAFLCSSCYSLKPIFVVKNVPGSLCKCEFH